MRSMSRTGWLAAVGATIALVAGGCGSSSTSSGGSSGATSSGSTTRGISATSINIGVITVLSTPLALTGFDTGVKAAFARANTTGGVDGRKLMVTDVIDDGANAAQDLAGAQKLVEQDKVFGVVQGTQSLASAPFLQQQHVPTTGWDISPQGCYRSYIFGITGCGVPTVKPLNNTGSAQALEQVLPPGVSKTVAVSLDDTVAGRAAAKQCAQAFTDLGYTVTATATIPTSGVSDYGPYASELMARAPSIVFECNSAGTIIGLEGALKAAGYKGIQANGILYDPRLLLSKQLAATLEGMYYVVEWGLFESNTAAVNQMISDLKGQSPKVVLNLASSAGYWSGTEMVQLLRHAGSKLTAEHVANAGNAGWTFSVPGGVCPVTFPAGHDNPVGVLGLAQLRDSTFHVAVPLACDAKLVPIK